MAPKVEHWIIFSSPAGTTRRVAEVAALKLRDNDQQVRTFDLGEPMARDLLRVLATNRPPRLCFWVGTPVYVSHPVPPVMAELAKLPVKAGDAAIPFVTWGGVSSGIALHELGRALQDRGCWLVGAAKVLAQHSSMWRSQRPLGAGHPDRGDTNQIRLLVDHVLERLGLQPETGLSLDSLNYQPENVQQEAALRSIEKARPLFSEFKVDSERCDHCQDCVRNCPAGAISWDALPRFGKSCFLCLKCIRNCPQQAIPIDYFAMEQRILGAAKASPEKLETRVFY